MTSPTPILDPAIRDRERGAEGGDVQGRGVAVVCERSERMKVQGLKPCWCVTPAVDYTWFTIESYLHRLLSFGCIKGKHILTL